ncbi:MAG: uroporphyrinogen-III C-methyltransferase [Acidobacteriia bacterium]|nr:uroporphyrinogen-III C-methyltransferase [Terriglobia bacterium]
MRMKGKVYLVGAGPGDPELLTMKACRILREAHVVLHDDLVNPEILELAAPSARVQNVGKRCGRPHISQEEIHSRIVTFAEEGLSVVRLKGGDPLLYGRAGEEMDALRRAGIEFEVVPGITAAFGAAASARIPLTDRRLASKVLFLSNHLCSGEDAPIEGNSISTDTTVVVYMPGAGYGDLATKFRAAGFDPRTRCLVVSSATTGRQQIHASTLDKLAATSNLPAPALLIVGGVAGQYSDSETPEEIDRASVETSGLSPSI